jgi:hypothetical protein
MTGGRGQKELLGFLVVSLLTSLATFSNHDRISSALDAVQSGGGLIDVPVIPPAGTQKASSLTGVVGAATVGGSNTELNSSSVRMNNGKAALLADKVEVFIQSNSSLVDPASVATTDIMSKSGVGSGTSQVVSKRNDNVSSTEKKTVTSSKASLSKNIGVTTGITNASKVAIKKKGNTTATKKKTKTKGSTTVDQWMGYYRRHSVSNELCCSGTCEMRHIDLYALVATTSRGASNSQ